MFRFVPILLLFFACNKNDTPLSTNTLLLDSVVTPQSGVYRVDLDNDGTKDLKLGWQIYPFGTSVVDYYAVALNSATKIHATEQTQPVCRDSLYNNNNWTITTHSCAGGPSQIRVDSFTATPNLNLSVLPNTTVSVHPSDSFLVHHQKHVWSMPTPPYTYNETIEHGFFYESHSGYMLFSINGKRVALRVNRPPAKFIDSLVKIDP